MQFEAFARASAPVEHSRAVRLSYQIDCPGDEARRSYRYAARAPEQTTTKCAKYRKPICMAKQEVILRFEEVSYERGPHKPILEGVRLSIRQGAKLTLMGQNGAGKSTLFHLINRELQPEKGKV